MSLHGNWFHLRIRWSQYQHWHLISYVSLPAWLRQIYLAVLMATSSLVLGSIVAGYVFILSVENFKFVMLFFAFSCYSCCSCELEWPHLRHSLTIHNDPHDTLVHFFEVIQGQRMQHSWTTFNHQQPQNSQRSEIQIIFTQDGEHWHLCDYKPCTWRFHGTGIGITFYAANGGWSSNDWHTLLRSSAKR